jgi:hypothetical protein
MLDRTALSCRGIGLVFESFNTLLSHDHIGILVAESVSFFFGEERDGWFFTPFIYFLLIYLLFLFIYTKKSISNAFVDSLSLKFLDTEWDVRDATIEFVGLLFKQVQSISFSIYLAY